ncbi:MAG TPA: carbohydrate ABC transporter permease [Chloroflexota bacterium]|nr:carbohydrate ABC transporter permease [Chloroflexota bacterium]
MNAARLRWPGRNVMFMATLATLMLPSIVTIIPTFLLMRYLHWIDTFYPLIVPSWAGGSAFSIFLFRQFFMTIPLELDEAARVDGANPLRIFWSIILPLSGPVLATVVIFDVLNYWNDLFNPLIFLNSESNYTMALGLTQYAVGHNGTFYNLQMAASVVMTIPVILLFFFAQRYFMRGIVTTGLAAR